SAPVGRTALIPFVLGARGTCFLRDSKASHRVHYARIFDCILARALLSVRSGELHDALAAELGPVLGERAWSLLVMHAAAVVMTAWEPQHRSALRRSAEAVESAMLEWLTREWRSGNVEPASSFAARYARAWRENHRSKE